MDFTRRTYVFGGMAAVAGVTGIGGVAAVQPDEGGATGTDGQPRSGYGCPAGTTLLATYEATDGGFEFGEGEDVVTFSDVEGDGRITEFSWESDEVVAVVAVDHRSALEEFEGGFGGTVAPSRQGGPIDTVRFCAPRGGRAVLAKLDLDSDEYQLDMEFNRPTEEPARTEDESDRSGVVRTISRTNDGTRDYAHSMVNVLGRRENEERIDLEDLTLENLTALSFDYYEGSENEGAVPDEVFVALLTEDDELWLAFTRADEDADGWNEFDVLSLMEDGDHEWRFEPTTIDGLRGGAEAVETAIRLRDSETVVSSIQDADPFSGSTRLAGVGVGAGNTRTATTVDRFYDDLTVQWNGDEEGGEETAVYDFPATVPVDVETDDEGGEIVVRLAFRREQEGVSFDDVDEETVKLNRFGPFVPPTGRGVLSEAVDVEEDEDAPAGQRLRVTFPRGDINQLLGGGGASGDRFIVSGDFDVPAGSSFYGTGGRDGGAVQHPAE